MARSYLLFVAFICLSGCINNVRLSSVADLEAKVKSEGGRYRWYYAGRDKGQHILIQVTTAPLPFSMQKKAIYKIPLDGWQQLSTLKPFDYSNDVTRWKIVFFNPRESVEDQIDVKWGPISDGGGPKGTGQLDSLPDQ